MALADDIRLLSEIAIFRQLDEDALRLLAFSAETKMLRSGDVLFREDDQSDGGYFLLSGTLELRAERDAGPLSVTAPALLGETALLTETTRLATATASSFSTVRHVTRALFHRVLQESPGGAAKVRALLASRIRDYAGELDAFASKERS